MKSLCHRWGMSLQEWDLLTLLIGVSIAAGLAALTHG
ncbi:hypothetical protein M2243_002416 [Heliophilum fasciatum]|nr:hypothetical protein [Heliophilum fasciatum]